MRTSIWPVRRAVWLSLSLSLALLSVSAAAQAFDAGSAAASASGVQPMAAQGTLQVAFTPGDDIEGLIVETLDKARKQILMQAYILTSKPLTNALIAAHKRNVDVRVLVDAEQLNKSGRERIADMQKAGIKVMQETRYKNAHNKVIVIDAGNADATVITGSYNFTWTAQNKNAENILVARKNPPLAAKYAANWMRHFQEAEGYQ